MSRIRPTCLEFFTTPGLDLLCSGPIRTPQRDLTILPDIQIESATLLPNYVYRTILTVFLHQILKWGKFLVFLPHKNCLNTLTKVTLVHKTFVKSGRLKLPSPPPHSLHFLSCQLSGIHWHTHKISACFKDVQ